MKMKMLEINSDDTAVKHPMKRARTNFNLNFTSNPMCSKISNIDASHHHEDMNNDKNKTHHNNSISDSNSQSPVRPHQETKTAIPVAMQDSDREDGFYLSFDVNVNSNVNVETETHDYNHDHNHGRHRRGELKSERAPVKSEGSGHGRSWAVRSHKNKEELRKAYLEMTRRLELCESESERKSPNS